jgi:alpha-glucosidase (family GH31 glycosyl hydrolase)
LPDGNWYDLHTDMLWNGNREISMEVPGYTIPLFIKASSLDPFLIFAFTAAISFFHQLASLD